jgi:hypothetical protein
VREIEQDFVGFAGFEVLFEDLQCRFIIVFPFRKGFLIALRDLLALYWSIEA